jgi:GDP-D-mannose dehydratase
MDRTSLVVGVTGITGQNATYALPEEGLRVVGASRSAKDPNARSGACLWQRSRHFDD